MIDLKIQKNVPIPDEAYHRRGWTNFPLIDMTVGDSFFTSMSRTSIGSAISRLKKKDEGAYSGRVFRFIEVNETGENNGKRKGIRCWRVK